MITQRNSAILIACLAWSMQRPAVASEQEHSANASSSVVSAPADMKGAQQATRVALTALATQTHLDAQTFKVVSTEPYTWPDSSLGCGRKGQMAAQVITHGYVVTVKSGAATHLVHATDRYAVVCERNMIMRNQNTVNAPLRNLDSMIDKARKDLADKLHAQPELIRTMTFVATAWPDTSMGCVVDGETVEQKEIRGYRIALNYKGRTFVYHTDMERVRACPPVETE